MESEGWPVQVARPLVQVATPPSDTDAIGAALFPNIDQLLSLIFPP